MSTIHADVARRIAGPVEGCYAKSPPGPDELAAAQAVLELCRQHEYLWRRVFRLRTVFGWSDTLKELLSGAVHHCGRSAREAGLAQDDC